MQRICNLLARLLRLPYYPLATKRKRQFTGITRPARRFAISQNKSGQTVVTVQLTPVASDRRWPPSVKSNMGISVSARVLSRVKEITQKCSWCNRNCRPPSSATGFRYSPGSNNFVRFADDARFATAERERLVRPLVQRGVPTRGHRSGCRQVGFVGDRAADLTCVSVGSQLAARRLRRARAWPGRTANCRANLWLSYSGGYATVHTAAPRPHAPPRGGLLLLSLLLIS